MKLYPKKQRRYLRFTLQTRGSQRSQTKRDANTYRLSVTICEDNPLPTTKMSPHRRRTAPAPVRELHIRPSPHHMTTNLPQLRLPEEASCGRSRVSPAH